MKINKFIIFLIGCSMALPAFAETKISKYDLCEISGYFSGSDEQFMFGVASYQNRSNSPEFFKGSQCMGLFQSGYKLGQKAILGHGEYTKNEYEIIKKSLGFRELIYKAIIKSAKIEVVE